MKKVNFVPQLFLVLAFSNTLLSQTYDKNAVTNEIKKYLSNPESFYLEQKDAKTRLINYHGTLDSLVTVNEELTTENTNLKSELEYTSKKIQNSNNNVNATSYNNNLNRGANGVEYRVQMGIFSDKNAVKAFENSSNISTTSYNNISNVYEFTGFPNEHAAFQAAQNMRKIGVNGAFVTKYVNGVRDRSYDYLNRNNPSETIIQRTTLNSSINSQSMDSHKQEKVNEPIKVIKSSSKTNYTAEELRELREKRGN